MCLQHSPLFYKKQYKINIGINNSTPGYLIYVQTRKICL